MSTPTSIVKVLSHLMAGGVVTTIEPNSQITAWKIIEGAVCKTTHPEDEAGEFFPITFSLSLYVDSQYVLEPIRTNKDSQPVKVATNLLSLKSIYAYTRPLCETVQYSYLNQEAIYDAHGFKYDRNAEYDRLMN